MNIQTPYNHVITPSPAGGRSLTIPDDTMSISEIVRRFSCGLPLNGQKVPFYDDDEDDTFEQTMPDVRKLDLSEIADLKEQVAADINKKQRALQAAQRKQQYPKKLRERVLEGDGETSPSKTSDLRLLQLQLEVEKLKNSKNTNQP